VGVRSTAQKRALAAVLARTATFRSAQELHAALRESGEPMGLTTVYNQLRALAEAGMVDVLQTGDGETLYRRCATPSHHHHLLCRVCGRTVEVEGRTVERWAARIAAQQGFVDVAHTLEFTGTCAGCARSTRGGGG
jgi:Fur family ferric uptake transcriptional regulator